MANFFVYCLILNLALCFALPEIGDRLGELLYRILCRLRVTLCIVFSQHSIVSKHSCCVGNTSNIISIAGLSYTHPAPQFPHQKRKTTARQFILPSIAYINNIILYGRSTYTPNGLGLAFLSNKRSC